MHNDRLNSPILARMGAHLSKTWDKLGPKLERPLVYGKEAGKIPGDGLADIRPGKGNILAEGPQGAEFLCSKKMQELKGVSPEMYEALVAATVGMKVGSCAGCEHCRNGVKIENTDE